MRRITDILRDPALRELVRAQWLHSTPAVPADLAQIAALAEGPPLTVLWGRQGWNEDMGLGLAECTVPLPAFRTADLSGIALLIPGEDLLLIQELEPSMTPRDTPDFLTLTISYLTGK